MTSTTFWPGWFKSQQQRWWPLDVTVGVVASALLLFFWIETGAAGAVGLHISHAFKSPLQPTLSLSALRPLDLLIRVIQMFQFKILVGVVAKKKFKRVFSSLTTYGGQYFPGFIFDQFRPKI